MYLRVIEYFEQAISRDPQYALAYAGIADAYNVLGGWEAGIGGIRFALPPHGFSSIRARLAPLGLAADRGDRDVAHRRIGLGAVPMALAGLDVHDIADVDLLLLVLGRDHAGARGHDQDLVAGMGMPTRRAALAEVHHAAVVVPGVAGLDDGLARPGNRPRN